MIEVFFGICGKVGTGVCDLWGVLYIISEVRFFRWVLGTVIYVDINYYFGFLDVVFKGISFGGFIC